MSDLQNTDQPQRPGVVVTGASGRMGRMLIRLILDSDHLRLVGALDATVAWQITGQSLALVGADGEQLALLQAVYLY